jgi:carboxyl-terminal processing protease
MPDKFVPVDTSGYPYFMAVRPLIYRFSLNYTETHREALRKYTEVREMEKYLNSQDLLRQFTDFASKNGIKKDPEGLTISGAIIHTQLKAYIARNLLDNKGFYPIWQEIDTTLKYAIGYLN